MAETKNKDNASRSGPGQTLKSCYVGTDIMESMIAWHREAQANVMRLHSKVLPLRCSNMTPLEHNRTGNTIDGSNHKVFNILIIFSFITTQCFNLVITYIKLLRLSLIEKLGG